MTTKWTYLVALTLICRDANYDVRAATCYECSSISGDCADGVCTGNFCVARIVQSQSPKNDVYTKECSATNPNSLKTVGCMKSIAGGTTAVSCACQTDYCNSRESIDNFFKNVTRPNDAETQTSFQKPTVDFNDTNNNNAHVSAKGDNTSSLLLPSSQGEDDLGELLVSCYECNSVTGDCVIGNCKGHWCKTSVSEDSAAGTKVVSKGCSNTHPNSVAFDSCVEVKVQSVTTVSCGCRRANFCNTAENVRLWLSRSQSAEFSTPNKATSNNSAIINSPKNSAGLRRRCHCTDGSEGCSRGVCFGDLCARTEFESGNEKAIHYCVTGRTEIGCHKGADKSSIVSTEHGVPPLQTTATSRTCFCDSFDFCNNSSSRLWTSSFLLLLLLATSVLCTEL